MKTASAKAKGRNLQKFVAKKITEIFRLREGDVESCSMGAGGVDIKLSPAARDKFPFSIECKSTKKFPSLSALVQSENNAYEETLSGVVWKPPGKSPELSLIYFDLDDFIKFWNKIVVKEKTD